MPATLHLEGRLELSDATQRIDVVANGSTVHAEIGDALTVRRFLQRVRVFKLARRLSRELDARGVSLLVTRDGAPFAELGAGARANPLARLFGLSLRLFRNKR